MSLQGEFKDLLAYKFPGTLYFHPEVDKTRVILLLMMTEQKVLLTLSMPEAPKDGSTKKNLEAKILTAILESRETR